MLSLSPKYILRSLFISANGPSRILKGRNAGAKLEGVGLSHVFGMCEPHLSSLIPKYVSQGDHVLDIGANVGYFTVMLARAVGDTGRVYAFEPIPDTFGLLHSNVEINQLRNVTLFNAAVSGEVGKLIFRIPNHGSNHSMASMHWHKDDPGAQALEVVSVVPDDDTDLIRERVSFIKIDVEGAEGDVLKGVKKIILKWRPVVFTECSEIGRIPFWEFMKAHEYSCFNAIDLSAKVVEFDHYRHGDYLWLPN